MNDQQFLAWARGRSLIEPQHEGKSAAFVADNALTFPTLSGEDADTIFEFLRESAGKPWREVVQRALTDIDVRFADEGRSGCFEFATFAEGEYVESVYLTRERAQEIYVALGKLLAGA